MSRIARNGGTYESISVTCSRPSLSGRERKRLSRANTYPIVQGSNQYTIEGRAVALDGMKTACGASLIASQQGFLASE
ncbi:PAAR domain-containing protein [Burkholderia cenocepacia]|nr:PAAR domain-containing protein [Burkholderia cenocepacia]